VYRDEEIGMAGETKRIIKKAGPPIRRFLKDMNRGLKSYSTPGSPPKKRRRRK